MSRFNPGRQSFLSRASSQGLQNDTSSIYGNDNSRNDEDFDDHFKLDDDDNDSLNGSSFQRRNSSRFGSTLSRSNIRVKKAPVLPSSEAANNSTNNESENSGIYIAPLQLFNENTSTPQLTPRLKTKNSSHDTKASDKKTRHKTNSSVVATIDEENILTSVKSPAKTEANDDFASIFTASLNTDTGYSPNNSSKNSSATTITDPFEKSPTKTPGN